MYGRFNVSPGSTGAGALLGGCGDDGGDEQTYTEAYPGKLCALCNLSEKSFLGQVQE